MAVPTGEYDLTASVDLSPLFGVIEKTTTVAVTRPGDDTLDVRLKELTSDDLNARRRALYDLRYFPKEGERIVPELVRLLKGDDTQLRSAVVSVFFAFPEGAREHIDLILSIVTGDRPEGERVNAAYLLSRVAPKDAKYEKALLDGVESSSDSMKPRFENALRNYRRRHPVEKPAGDTGS